MPLTVTRVVARDERLTGDKVELRVAASALSSANAIGACE